MNNPQVKIVNSFTELIKTPFSGLNNAHCWQRSTNGNFEEIVEKLELKEDITEVTSNDLLRLNLTSEGDLARKIILEDLINLTEFGAQPSLNLLKKYERDNDLDFLSTDVYSWHVDRSPYGIDTYLCTYFGSSSDIISNDEVIQKITIPSIKAELFRQFEIENFEEFVQENFFDLHYQALPSAMHINLGNGHLWRLAVDSPQQKVKPCVHRAPIENGLRLMLIC